MKGYVRFTIYVNMPSLLVSLLPVIHSLTTGGNWRALMTSYSLVLYIIPVAIILIYLIRSLIKGLKPNKINMTLYFILSTVCMMLFIIAWSVPGMFVALLNYVIFFALLNYAISYIAVKLYKKVCERIKKIGK